MANHSRPIESWIQGLQNNSEDLPPLESRQEALHTSDKATLASPAEIERPRSALHSGDFTEGAPPARIVDPISHQGFNGRQELSPFGRLGSSPTTPWYNHPLLSPLAIPDHVGRPSVDQTVMPGSRSRAPSLGSFPSSYVLKAPTSPLVHQANNTDLDFSPRTDLVDFSSNPGNGNRRRTLPPETFRQLRGSPPVHSRGVNFSRSYASIRREESFPYQAHQPRRSITSAYSLQPASSPQTLFRSRRPSFASDLSPIIHAPMVGSYEESILRGRMSTTPSKPLDFTAQIGVLGKGKCKANLRCPPHVTVHFPAVFYSYPTSGSGRTISDDSPSPYVGMIDLENSLPPDTSSENKHRRRHADAHNDHAGLHSDNTHHLQSIDRRRREKKLGRPDSLKAPPGGSYRIPQRGQLQIVIKNPDKTAVKLFLVPYDLDDMEPGTKTFIRQRSYSAGPVIDMPLTARKNFGTDRPEASLNPTTDPKDKPTLRYLIHLNICCPARGRFYLHSTIRVVFANRVPDGKEKLRNEIQYPEPRYSPYKPTREAHNVAGARTVADRDYRRRSAGVGLAADHIFQDGSTYIPSPYPQRVPSASRISAIPFKLPVSKDKAAPKREDGSFQDSTLGGPWQPTSPDPFQNTSAITSFSDSSQFVSPKLQSPMSPQSDRNGEFYNKLSRGDAGYGGGYPFASTSNGTDAGQSLLAKKLRDLTSDCEEPFRGEDDFA